jgi:GAF domain-containing protein
MNIAELYPVPSNETQRLEALKRYALLDTPAEQAYDDFARLAAYICGTPIALITLVDKDRQWFKANVGLDVSETPRDQAFCAHTIMGDDALVIADAQADARFAANPLVTGAPHIRFYAGAPLIDSEGYALGSLCAIDRTPRQLDDAQLGALEALARQVVSQFEYRRASADLANALEHVKTLHGLLPICTYCKNIRNDKGYWRTVEEYIGTMTNANLSHGVCPDCLREHFPEVADEILGDSITRS